VAGLNSIRGRARVQELGPTGLSTSVLLLLEHAVVCPSGRPYWSVVDRSLD